MEDEAAAEYSTVFTDENAEAVNKMVSWDCRFTGEITEDLGKEGFIVYAQFLRKSEEKKVDRNFESTMRVWLRGRDKSKGSYFYLSPYR